MKENYSVKFARLAAVASVIGAQTFAVSTPAAPLSDEEAQALIQRVNELEQQVKILQRNREVDREVAEAKPKDTPTVELGMNGLMIRSADSNFTMIAHGYAQADTRTYFGQKTTPDTFLLRRVRPIVEGTFWSDFNYRVMLDLASGTLGAANSNNVNILDDAYVNAHFWQQFQIQAGKFKSPVGLERLQSTADLFFVETGFATELTPNYDLGAEIHNDLFNTPINYAIGIFNGAADNASLDADADQGKDVAGRLFAQPFLNSESNPLKGLGFGAGGSIGTRTAGALTTYKTPGQQTFFTYANVAPTGNQYRIDPQAYYFVGPFGLLGEYVLSSQKFRTTSAALPPNERFNNAAWQVEASYFLTGEENSFKATSLKHVIPLRRFRVGENSWGAFEVVARAQQLSLDQRAFVKHGAAGTASATPGSAQKATAFGVGLNWYLNANLKLNLNYEATTYTGGAPLAGAAASAPEHALLGRVQFSF